MPMPTSVTFHRSEDGQWFSVQVNGEVVATGLTMSDVAYAIETASSSISSALSTQREAARDAELAALRDKVASR